MGWESGTGCHLAVVDADRGCSVACPWWVADGPSRSMEPGLRRLGKDLGSAVTETSAVEVVDQCGLLAEQPVAVIDR